MVAEALLSPPRHADAGHSPAGGSGREVVNSADTIRLSRYGRSVPTGRRAELLNTIITESGSRLPEGLYQNRCVGRQNAKLAVYRSHDVLRRQQPGRESGEDFNEMAGSRERRD